MIEELENVFVSERFHLDVLLDVAKAGEVVENLALGALTDGRERATLRQLPDLLQGEGIALDGR